MPNDGHPIVPSIPAQWEGNIWYTGLSSSPPSPLIGRTAQQADSLLLSRTDAPIGPTAQQTDSLLAEAILLARKFHHVVGCHRRSLPPSDPEHLGQDPLELDLHELGQHHLGQADAQPGVEGAAINPVFVIVLGVAAFLILVGEAPQIPEAQTRPVVGAGGCRPAGGRGRPRRPCHRTGTGIRGASGCPLPLPARSVTSVTSVTTLDSTAFFPLPMLPSLETPSETSVTVAETCLSSAAAVFPLLLPLLLPLLPMPERPWVTFSPRKLGSVTDVTDVTDLPACGGDVSDLPACGGSVSLVSDVSDVSDLSACGGEVAHPGILQPRGDILSGWSHPGMSPA